MKPGFDISCLFFSKKFQNGGGRIPIIESTNLNIKLIEIEDERPDISIFRTGVYKIIKRYIYIYTDKTSLGL